VRPKYFSNLSMSILLLTLAISIPLFVLTITLKTASANQTQENFTIVALPDTQFYSSDYPWIFENQTEWIVQNENALNIVFVTHLGDIVNDYWEDYEWQNADNAMSILDNKVPYGILPGNHDIASYLIALEYDNYFPSSRYQGYSYWGGSYDSKVSPSPSLSPNMNNYQLFSAGGMDFIALSLMYDPPADVLSWADNVLNKYSNRRAIISTHVYLDTDGNREYEAGPGIWNFLVVPHKNVFLVLCGHEVDSTGIGEAERIDNLDHRTVYQLLSDYQGLDNGGDGYLRIMEFAPSQNTIYVRTYSPYLDNYMTGSSSQFQLYYPMSATAGGISLMVYVGTIAVIVVIIAAVLILKVV
jgi:hypothetical protein